MGKIAKYQRLGDPKPNREGTRSSVEAHFRKGADRLFDDKLLAVFGVQAHASSRLRSFDSLDRLRGRDRPAGGEFLEGALCQRSIHPLLAASVRHINRFDARWAFKLRSFYRRRV